MADSESGLARWIPAALTEYEAHRAEVLAEGQGQSQTLAFGATAVGILFAGALNVWEDRSLATIAFLGAIPLLCLLVLVQWAGRAFGIIRVGVYLEALENALQTAYSAPTPLLTWERALLANRPKEWWKPHYGWSDLGALAVLVVLAAGSIAIGAYRGFAANEVLVVVLTAVQGAILAVFTAFLVSRLSKVREDARRDFRTPNSGDSLTAIRPDPGMLVPYSNEC